jgi:hypothetical protein
LIQDGMQARRTAILVACAAAVGMTSIGINTSVHQVGAATGPMLAGIAFA